MRRSTWLWLAVIALVVSALVATSRGQEQPVDQGAVDTTPSTLKVEQANPNSVQQASPESAELLQPATPRN